MPRCRDERHILVMGREGFAQGERGPAARRAEHDAASRECVNAFVNALGHGFVIGEQGEVHVGGDESDRGEVGIGEVRGKHVILSGLGGARLDVRRYCIARVPHIGTKAVTALDFSAR